MRNLHLRFVSSMTTSSVSIRTSTGLMSLLLLCNLCDANNYMRGESRPHRLAQPNNVSGAIYYLDSREGDDSHAGTNSATPWKSLERVNATTFRPGDRILLKSGSMWQGQLWPKGSGVEGQPIKMGTYGKGAKPMINGHGLFEDTVLLKNQEYWEIEGLEITNTGP